jgi:hypothetical protein
MNEIILAPCDVISKIKQNSSDMNEIILASCDAGYVQSCTGLIITLLEHLLTFVQIYITLSSLCAQMCVFRDPLFETRPNHFHICTLPLNKGAAASRRRQSLSVALVLCRLMILLERHCSPHMVQK